MYTYRLDFEGLFQPEHFYDSMFTSTWHTQPLRVPAALAGAGTAHDRPFPCLPPLTRGAERRAAPQPQCMLGDVVPSPLSSFAVGRRRTTTPSKPPLLYRRPVALSPSATTIPRALRGAAERTGKENPGREGAGRRGAAARSAAS